MTRRPSSYPHPVLGVNDDVSGSFSCAVPVVDVEAKVTRIAVTDLKTTNTSIANAITEKKVAFVLTYRCGATFLRRSEATFADRIDLQLENGSLSGRVELVLSVNAMTELSWRPDGLHPDYGDTTFKLPRGTVIAVGPEFSFEVSDEFDPLTGSVSSLFTAICTDEQSAPARLRFDSDNKIQILLSKLEHAQFNKAKAQIPGLIHSGLAYPALVHAITRLNDPQDGDEEKTWFQRLTAIVESKGCDQNDPFASASIILARPFERSTIDALHLVLPQGDE